MGVGYRLLTNSTGVLLNHTAQIVRDALFVSFENAPQNATAIFECGGKECYRKLLELNSCAIPATFLNGTVKVSVAILDGSARPKKWSCENLSAERQQDGSVLLAPEDTDLPQKVANQQIEIDRMREEIKELSQKVSELLDRIQTMLEGYDI